MGKPENVTESNAANGCSDELRLALECEGFEASSSWIPLERLQPAGSKMFAIGGVDGSVLPFQMADSGMSPFDFENPVRRRATNSPQELFATGQGKCHF
jgi:hypothetical protein